ncbi:MAG: CBS and ACT domain-containing protein [Desulfomonilaceae bacterium]
MLVKYWMRRDVVTVDIDDSMQHAISLIKEHQMPMLPVLKDGRLAGIITDRDLKRASASDATSLDVHELIYLLSRIRIGDIMSKNPITVPPDYSVEEAAAVLLKNKISGAPVVDTQGRIIGSITQLDLFRALISLTGLEKRGVQFAFELEDRPGSIKDVTDVIRAYGGRLVSILSSYERAPDGFRNVYIRAFDIDREKMSQLTEELKGKARMLYMVDHREDKREEYVDMSPAA